MANINGAINKTVFTLNTTYPTSTDVDALKTSIDKLQLYVANVENCGYPERCQTSTCQACQSCQSNSNCNCCSGGDDDGSNY